MESLMSRFESWTRTTPSQIATLSVPQEPVMDPTILNSNVSSREQPVPLIQNDAKSIAPTAVKKTHNVLTCARDIAGSFGESLA